MLLEIQLAAASGDDVLVSASGQTPYQGASHKPLMPRDEYFKVCVVHVYLYPEIRDNNNLSKDIRLLSAELQPKPPSIEHGTAALF
jgi:hypothetical protein